MFPLSAPYPTPSDSLSRRCARGTEDMSDRGDGPEDLSDEEITQYHRGPYGGEWLKVRKDSGEVCSITARECCRWYAS